MPDDEHQAAALSPEARPPACIGVWTTFGDHDSAAAMAHALVDARLAACAQLEAIESWYVWDGTLRADREWRLLLKTTAAHWDAVADAIRSRHPYDLPAIHAVALTPIDAVYARWIAAQTAPAC